MSEDRRRPAQYASLRDAALRTWIATEVHPYSKPLRASLDRAGLGRSGVRSADDLRRLPVTTLADLGDGRDHVLTPTATSVRSDGDLKLRVKLAVGRLRGDGDDVARREVDAAYRPVSWTAAPGPGGTALYTASTSTDLDVLAALGRRGLSISGLRVDDRVLVTEGVGAGVGARQLLEGCRSGGVAVMQLDPDLPRAVVDDAAPTVVTGTPSSLRSLLSAGPLPASVRLAVVHTWPPGLDEDPALHEDPALQEAPALQDELGVPVSRWWAPTGVRSAWIQCPGGEGFHTWPTHEHLDADGGPVVWSAVGWRGSVWLRVALGMQGRLDATACGSCGRTTPRLLPEPATETIPPATASPDLSGIDGLGDWLVVQRASGPTVVVQPERREDVDAVKASVADRHAGPVVVLSPTRFRAVRELAGAERVVAEELVAPALRRRS